MLVLDGGRGVLFLRLGDPWQVDRTERQGTYGKSLNHARRREQQERLLEGEQPCRSADCSTTRSNPQISNAPRSFIAMCWGSRTAIGRRSIFPVTGSTRVAWRRSI